MAIERVPSRPGAVLLKDFMEPAKLSANALARALDVPPNRITQILAADNPRAVTADTALRLARYFGTTPHVWLNLQLEYDLAKAIEENGAYINEVVRVRKS